MSGLSEEQRERNRGLYDAFAVIIQAATDDPTGHLSNCGYDDSETCDCARYGRRVYDALKKALAAERAAGAAEALHAAAEAARGMHDPVAPDCAEWADWLDIRAALEGDPS